MSNRKLTFTALSLLTLGFTALPNRASAQEATVTESGTIHGKNRLFLRAQFGMGSTSNKSTAGGESVDYHGMAHAFSFSAGFTFRNNLAIYGQFTQHGSRQPKRTIENNNGTETLYASQNMLLATGTLNIGVTQYFSPYNLYWDASVGAGSLQVIARGFNHATDLGPAASIALGKEWIMGPHLGIGVSAQLHLARTFDSDAYFSKSGGHFTSRTMVIGISGTYN